jgi:hypothetical protein
MPLIGTDQLGNLYSIVIDSVSGAITTTPVQNVSPSTADNSITTTAMAQITSAMRLIGVLASGEVPQLSEATDALMVLQQMIDSWNADRLAIYTTSASDYALVQGQQAYTLGPGGDFNTGRPAQIDSMSAILITNPDNPIEVPINMYTVDQWQSLPVKNVPGSFPIVCYDDGGFPLRTLSMWPIPVGQPVNLRIYAWQSLSVPATLQTNLAFPPGYAEAFRYNLAVRLAPEFDADLSPVVQAIAVESLARVKTMNAPDLRLQSDLVNAGASGDVAFFFGLPYGGPTR